MLTLDGPHIISPGLRVRWFLAGCLDGILVGTGMLGYLYLIFGNL